jgi:hypothetical protein
MYGTATQGETRRGIYCKYCGKPVRLSHSLLVREEAIKQNESAIPRICSPESFRCVARSAMANPFTL